MIAKATSVDCVRIEELGCGRALTINAGWILAVNKVLRAAEDFSEFTIYQFEEGFMAELGDASAYDVTPWGAVLALAHELERDGL